MDRVYYIVSTPKGVVTGYEARSLNVGGELLCRSISKRICHIDEKWSFLHCIRVYICKITIKMSRIWKLPVVLIW